MTKKKTQLKRTVIANIKKGKARMKPKSHFVIHGALFGVGMFAALILTALITSSMILSMRANGIHLLPGFGKEGWATLMGTFPWLLTAFALILLLLAHKLVTQYSFAYRQPVILSLAGVMFITGLTAIAVDQASMKTHLHADAQMGKGPIAPVYKTLVKQHSKPVYFGNITATTTNGFVILSQEGEILEIFIMPKTQIIPQDAVQIESWVVVGGRRDGDIVHAFGVKRAEDKRPVEYRTHRRINEQIIRTHMKETIQ